MRNRIKIAKKENICAKGVKIRVEVPDEDYLNKLSYNKTTIAGGKQAVNDLRHASKVYIKINGTRMRGYYDDIWRLVSQSIYFEVKEKIYSEICNKYPFLVSAVYLQRCMLSKRKNGELEE